MNNIEAFLYVILIILVFAVVALAVVFVMLKKKEKNVAVEEDETAIQKPTEAKTTSTNVKIAKEYEKKSVFDFMDFEDVKDNMIIQKGGKKFLMVIECKGINYDLMSEVEKTAVEQGFSAFLNTLREPIQIYIQTRTINLEKNIAQYKEKVEKMQDDINLKEYRLKEYASRPNINQKALKDKQFELFRQKNLYYYGSDIVENTQKMSLNKNILKKKYYIILKYFYEATDGVNSVDMSPEEIREIAFSNLYTKALSLISVLSGMGVIGKALDSYGLVELLYNAFNRDDSEVYGIEKALEAGYNEIYVDSDNIIDKKLVALNKEIQIRAEEAAKKALEMVAEERAEELREIEENIDSIVEELAKQIIADDKNNLPEDIKQRATKKVGRKKKGVEETNDKSNTKESNRKSKAS